jgi:hypothetical protein
MNVVKMKGTREAPRAQRSSMETLIVSVDQVNKWVVPPFQRPLHVNPKVQALAEQLKRDGVSISGTVTLGRLPKDDTVWIVDGQHRLEAFKITGMPEVIVDVRIVHFENMAEMAEEFVRLNSALVRMRPDDLLRGLEPTAPALQRIRRECPFVGYDGVRRGGATSPVLGMSIVLRCWGASAAETPANHLTGRTVTQYANELDELETGLLVKFLNLAFAAWGREPEYFRLWAALNLTMCAWLYRRLVVDRVRGVKRFVLLNDAEFRQCLMALSADALYLDYLQGRVVGDRDRSPTYNHLRRIFSKRLQAAGNERPLMPQPAWAKT